MLCLGRVHVKLGIRVEGLGMGCEKRWRSNAERLASRRDKADRPKPSTLFLTLMSWLREPNVYVNTPYCVRWSTKALATGGNAS